MRRAPWPRATSRWPSMEAVSKQDYTDALAQARQAECRDRPEQRRRPQPRRSTSATRAFRRRSAAASACQFTEGALVTANQAEALTTITRLDPVYVDIQQSAPDLLALRRSLAQGGVVPTTAQVRLKLPDGSDYGYTGTVQFTEVVVDADTGSVTLRARFPNPQSMLLPGMFVTAQFAQAINTTAYLVPQPAITRDPKGNATCGSSARQHRRAADRCRRADRWRQLGRDTQGLAGGEKVITQGIANLREGAKIKPVPASTPQRVKPAQGRRQVAQS